MTMLVRDVMTSPAVTVRECDEAAHAVEVLDRLSLTSLPVVDDEGRLIGLVGEADVIRQLAVTTPVTAHHRRLVTTRVRDVMARHVLTIRADDDIAAAVALMSGTGVKSLPVVLHERVAGMLSRRDIIRALAHGDLDSETPALAHA